MRVFQYGWVHFGEKLPKATLIERGGQMLQSGERHSKMLWKGRVRFHVTVYFIDTKKRANMLKHCPTVLPQRSHQFSFHYWI
jgi:hypothetical protein